MHNRNIGDIGDLLYLVILILHILLILDIYNLLQNCNLFVTLITARTHLHIKINTLLMYFLIFLETI